MALKEDYKDAVFAGLRKYKMLDNGDGTVSPVDMTEYEAAGDKFGAKDVNAITKMVNCTGDAFDPGRDYEVGDYTIYDNTVWKFTTAHPAGEWDESHVEKTRILVEIAEQNKNFGALTENIKNLVLLWENTNNLNFAAQTITLSSGNYDYLEVFYATSDGAKIVEVSSCKALKGFSLAFQDVLATSTYSSVVRRSVTFVSETEFSVSNCIRNDTVINSQYQYGKTDNKRIFPYKIYGGKF